MSIYTLILYQLSYNSKTLTIGIHHKFNVLIIHCGRYNPVVTVYTKITSLGKQARDLLRANDSGRIYGRTSRGDFLLLGERDIVFLSFEIFKGPLTINIQREASICNRIKSGDTVILADNGIVFPDFDWVLTYPPGDGWRANLPARDPLPEIEIQQQLKIVASGLLAKKPAGIVSSNLSVWLELAGSPQRRESTGLSMPEFRAAIVGNEPLKTLHILSPLIGLGDGLTPSGDDLILGFILAYSRWGPVLSPKLDLTDLLPPLYELMDQRTTLLSCSLVKAAGTGQADERLIDALDGIVTGVPATDQCVEALSDWGNHSGGDALTGIALFLLTSR